MSGVLVHDVCQIELDGSPDLFLILTLLDYYPDLSLFGQVLLGVAVVEHGDGLKNVPLLAELDGLLL